MPHHYFHADVTRDETRTFHCTLQCRRCEATKRNGAQCNRQVCIWLPFCWQHTRSELGIRPGPSGVLDGATGLFAHRSFQKGDLVAPYGGERVTDAMTRERYGLSSSDRSLGPYLLGNVDSACLRYVASAPNGAFGSVPESAANITFEATTHAFGAVRDAGFRHPRLGVLSRSNLGVKYWAVARRDIEAGEEIVAFYGKHGRYEQTFSQRQNECERRGVVCDETRRSKRKAKR